MSRSQGFEFFDATLLLVRSGQLTLEDGESVLEASDGASVLVIPRNARLNVTKSPGTPEGAFRSVFLTFSQRTLTEFNRLFVPLTSIAPSEAVARKVPVDDVFADTISYCLRGLAADISSEEQAHRLNGILLALAERGWQYARPTALGTVDRLRDIIRDDPSRSWTALDASNMLAMSEATLRRRLAKESARFEETLANVRMHHAMMLLQTTRLSVPQVAKACGYRTRTRFSERFRERFGCSPSQAR